MSMNEESDLLLLPLVIIPLILLMMIVFYFLGVSVPMDALQRERLADRLLDSRAKSLKRMSLVSAMSR